MMSQILPFLLLFGLCHSKSTRYYKFPKEFQKCRRSDPNMDYCLKNAIESAIRAIGSTGMHSLGFPPIDPIAVTEIHIGEGKSAVNLVQNYYNVKLFGIQDSKVETAHFDTDKLKLNFILAADVEQRALYNITGKILIMPVFGEGDSVNNFYNATANVTYYFKEEMRTNVKYYVVEDCIVELKCTSAHYDFKNLFNGDKRLADNILRVINDNALEIFYDVREGIEKSYALMFKALAKQFFDKVPADEIFPE